MLDKVLLKFSENPIDTFTIDDALNGVSIFGEGNAKNASSGKALAIKYLQSGWGGIVVCPNSFEAMQWKQYSIESEREKDLIIFGNDSVFQEGEFKGQTMVFNPIQFLLTQNGTETFETSNITNFLMNVFKFGNRVAGKLEVKDRYWDNALQRCLNRVIDLLKLADESISFMNMVKLLKNSLDIDKDKFFEEIEYVKEFKDFSRLENKNRYCEFCLIKAYYTFLDEDNKLPAEIFDTYEMLHNYFLHELNDMDWKTKSIVKECFLGFAEPFLTGLLARQFTGDSNLNPNSTFLENKIIVLDFPVTKFPEIGVICQSIFKLLFQQSLTRRNIISYPNPVFLWANGAQYFLNPYEKEFLSTSRSSRLATVFLSCNIPEYYLAMAYSQDAISKVETLMGNLTTKIFHANSDIVTNEYASKLIGVDTTSNGSKVSIGSFLKFNNDKPSNKTNFPQVLPKEFTMFRNGGKANDFNVDSIVFKTGKKWSSGTNFMRTTFKQTS